MIKYIQNEHEKVEISMGAAKVLDNGTKPYYVEVAIQKDLPNERREFYEKSAEGNEEDATLYFNEMVSHYEQSLGVKAVEDESLTHKLKTMTDKMF